MAAQALDHYIVEIEGIGKIGQRHANLFGQPAGKPAV
jgi:hypothetical protein